MEGEDCRSGIGPHARFNATLGRLIGCTTARLPQHIAFKCWSLQQTAQNKDASETHTVVFDASGVILTNHHRTRPLAGLYNVTVVRFDIFRPWIS